MSYLPGMICGHYDLPVVHELLGALHGAVTTCIGYGPGEYQFHNLIALMPDLAKKNMLIHTLYVHNGFLSIEETVQSMRQSALVVMPDGAVHYSRTLQAVSDIRCFAQK